MEYNLKLNDEIVMKKKHACGENKWRITRVGVDLKLKCVGCGHEIMMDRLTLYKKMKKKVSEIDENIKK